MVTTGNGLCSLTVTAVCRIGWSLLATGMGGFPSPEGRTGERERSKIEKVWDNTLVLHSYLKHRLLFEGTENSGIIRSLNY